MKDDKKRVLIIDDDTELIKLMNIYFKNSGVVVRVESNGKAGIKAIDKFQPDVLILDIAMPKMNGIQVCKKIRITKNKHILPIIAFTAYHKDETKKAMMAAGANLYLIKPIEMSSLLNHAKTLAAMSQEEKRVAGES